MRGRRAGLVFVGAAALAGACSKTSGARDAGTDAAPIVSAYAAQALAISNEYLAWGRVDDELRWAPGLCRAPSAGIPRPSQSDDPSTHGRKLYSVFAKNHAAYPNGPHTGQAVVKQSWVPELVAAEPDGGSRYLTRGMPDADHFYPYVRGDGGVYHAAAQADLYLMFKVEPATPDTDEGWVYATISPARQVTSAGRVASCMTCHEAAEHERLFGVPKSPNL
jgi:hypothetical protein